MTVMMVMMAAALGIVALLVVVMVVMMVMLMLVLIIVIIVMMVVAALVIIIVIVVIMMMMVAALVIIVVIVIMVMMVMLMLVLIIVIIVIVVMMMMVAATLVLLVLIVVMMVMMMLGLGLCLLHHLSQQIVDLVCTLDCGKDVLAVQLLDRGGDDGGLRIVLTDQGNDFLNLRLIYLIGTAQDDGACILDLVHKELAKVLDIHLCLGSVHYSHCAVDLHIQVSCGALDGLQHVAELTHSGGLDEDALRCILIDDFLQGSTEITHQTAADTSAVHFLDLNAGLLQESAVDTDLTELILDQNGLASI
jgi:hypothetical protein